MKKILSATLAIGIVAASVSIAFAQQPSETATPGSYPPGSYYAPMHPDHDKAPSVREDNNNGIMTGRSSSQDDTRDTGGATTQGMER